MPPVFGPVSPSPTRLWSCAEASATAQGYLAVALGLAMAAAMGVSGVLYARWGSFAYVTMALLAAAGGVFALAARRLTGGT